MASSREEEASHFWQLQAGMSAHCSSWTTPCRGEGSGNTTPQKNPNQHDWEIDRNHLPPNSQKVEKCKCCVLMKLLKKYSCINHLWSNLTALSS